MRAAAGMLRVIGVTANGERHLSLTAGKATDSTRRRMGRPARWPKSLGPESGDLRPSLVDAACVIVSM